MSLPTNPFASYWPWWISRRLVDYPTTFNILWLFSASPVGGAPGSTGAVNFNVAPNNWTGPANTNMNADIATCRARGQKIILSVGGAGRYLYIQNLTRANAFVQSIKDINVQLGGSGTTLAIDGIDFNTYESQSNVNVVPAWMTYVGQQLKSYYGSDFIITTPPAILSTDDRILLATMYDGGALDWIAPQFYDGLSGTGAYATVGYAAYLAKVKQSLDFYNTAITIDGHSVQIPRSLLGVGFGIQTPTWHPGIDAQAGGYWGNSTGTQSAVDITSAWNDLVATGYAPKGTFNWALHLDPQLYFTQLAPYVNNYVEPLTPHFSLALSTQFTNGAATTAQLTAPSGKTAGADFQAGTINESSNPAAALNLTTGKYTELEWCLEATDDAIDAAEYEFRVTYDGVALDTYSVTPSWTVGTPPAPPDTTAPTTPTNLNATTVSSSQINLTWTASTDAVGVTGYRIYRGGVLIDTTASTAYNDTGLTASTLYSYTVSAIDAATNESAQSSSDSDTTSAAPVGDVTPPVVTITGPALSPTELSGTVTLEATATDNVGVANVKFYVGGILVGTDSTPTGITFSVSLDTTTKSNGAYFYDVVAADAAGNEDHQNALIRITNSGSPPLIPDPPKTATGCASMRGVLTLNL